MQVYKLTETERLKLESISKQARDVILIVCDLPGIGPCVEKTGLDDVAHQDWRDQLDVTLRLESLVDFDDVEITK
jgi:hypothetical protein